MRCCGIKGWLMGLRKVHRTDGLGIEGTLAKGWVRRFRDHEARLGHRRNFCALSQRDAVDANCIEVRVCVG